MRQLRLLTSLFVLCATALSWAGPGPEPYSPAYEPVGRQVYSNYPDQGQGRQYHDQGRQYHDQGRYNDQGRYYDQGRPYPGPGRVGRQDGRSCPQGSCPTQACPETCPPVCKPACRPAAAPTQQCCRPLIQCKHPNSNECCHDGIAVKVKQPKLCILGDTYALDVHIEACEDVCDVVVKANLPEGVSVVRSEPAGVQIEGHRAVWRIDGMSKGDTQCSRLFLRADREGDLCVCFCATAVPVRFCGLLCAKPVLTCDKCGPEEVCPGDPVHYTIRVTNTGSCAAEEVSVRDVVPAELEHSSCLRELKFNLGTIQPCETKTINVCMTAVKRGRACNRIYVESCNANQTSCEWCTNICQCLIELKKTGPTEVAIGKTAEYTITVTNPGDKSLTDVIVTDNAPTPTSIVEAKGAQVNGNQAIWRFRELKAGESQTMILVLTTCTPGTFCNTVSVTNCQGCTANSEACTRWKGRPALNLCVDQAENPICVGEPNTYVIRVTNQGSEEDTNVNMIARFPDGVQPTAGSGATCANVNGQTVTFQPYTRIGPRQTIEYRVDAKARKSGDSRVKFEVTSDSIKTPIVQEESTIVN
jgi:uncharacterized repeat protein (TIGR01451 family)